MSCLILLSWFSSYIVLRKEVLFTHALSNTGFLGIALAILFNLPISPMLILVCICAAIFIRFLQERGLFSNDSLLAIVSQLGLAIAIIVIYLFPGYRVNVEQYLFGDVLAVTNSDLYVSIGLFFFVFLMVYFCHKNFLVLNILFP